MEKQESKSNSEYMLLIDLLQKINNNEILTADLKIEDGNGVKWMYNTIAKQFTNQSDRLLTYYNDIELLFLPVKVLPREIKLNIAEEKALKEVIIEIEDMYEEIEQELDACQGCINNLDVYFAKLDLYKNIVKSLGGDIDKDKKEMVDRFYKKAKEQDEIKNNKNEIIKSIYTKINMPLDVFLSNEPKDKLLFDLYMKTNDICKFLSDNYKLFEEYKNQNNKE